MCDYNKRFKELAQLRMMKTELEAEIKAIEDEIKEHMETEGIEELLGDEHKAIYKAITSNRFDSTWFKKDHADMYEAYKRPNTAMRFTFN